MSDKPEEWQNVTKGLSRIPVPGGWLYRTTAFYSGFDVNHGSAAVALVFVPDPTAMGHRK